MIRQTIAVLIAIVLVTALSAYGGGRQDCAYVEGSPDCISAATAGH
jgi:hypothetical protein